MIVASSNKGYNINKIDRWLEEYSHVYYYDSTERRSDEPKATDSEQNLSESYYISTDDEYDESVAKSISEQGKESESYIGSNMSESS